ncbi:MAG: hypothetical protein H7245_20915 [Candidatus Saccharibacteria bacterium]|nr:hypothetical protein [Pseudorhodobacter sp.]
MVDLDESRFGKRVAFGAYADQRLALVHRRAGIPADVVPAIFLPGDGKLVLADTHCRRHGEFFTGLDSDNPGAELPAGRGFISAVEQPFVSAKSAGPLYEVQPAVS